MPSGECADASHYISVTIYGYYSVLGEAAPVLMVGGEVSKFIFINFDVNQSCTIKLSGLPADIEPGKEVKNLRADVTCDGVPTPKEAVLTVKALETTGGHNHVPGRPDGELNPSGGSSPLSFSFIAPAPAGDHTITAKCVDGSCGEDTGKVWVGVKGLQSIGSGPWELVGQDDAHPNNHHLAPAAYTKIARLAHLYRLQFPNDPALRLNDASLVRGGLFDIAYPARTAFWAPPHQTHRRGTEIDMRANEFVNPDAIPHRNYFEFEDIAIDVGCGAGMHSEFTRNQHYHVTCK